MVNARVYEALQTYYGNKSAELVRSSKGPELRKKEIKTSKVEIWPPYSSLSFFLNEKAFGSFWGSRFMHYLSRKYVRPLLQALQIHSSAILRSNISQMFHKHSMQDKFNQVYDVNHNWLMVDWGLHRKLTHTQPFDVELIFFHNWTTRTDMMWYLFLNLKKVLRR